MAIESIKKLSVTVRLENGRDTSGNMRYVGISLGSLSKDGFDADKALAVVELLKPCLNKSVGYTEKTAVSTLSAA